MQFVHFAYARSLFYKSVLTCPLVEENHHTFHSSHIQLLLLHHVDTNHHDVLYVSPNTDQYLGCLEEK